MNRLRRAVCTALAASPVALGMPIVARGDTLPSSIKIIVVVPPGATMDVVARVIAEKLSSSLERHVIVDYKPGGTGLLAAQYMKGTEPDGANLLFSPLPAISFSPFLYSSLQFDPDKDLTPVCDGVQVPVSLVTALGTEAATLAEYLDKARANVSLGSVGTSSMSSIGAFIVVLLGQQAKVDLQLVPYKGGQPLLTDLLGNQVPAGMSVISDYLTQHQAGKIRILAVSSKDRSALAPTVPTFVESGFPDLHGTSSIGFFVRGGTPQAVIDRYQSAINDALQSPDVKQRFMALGMEPAGGTQDAYAELILSERERWGPVAKAANIRIN